MRQVLANLTIAASLGACALPTPLASPATGSNRDAHGCIGSAGYNWSNVRRQCVRIFEAGLAFEPDPLPRQGAVLSAFVVLAPAQGKVTAAELFVPGLMAPIALTLAHAPEGEVRPVVLENKAEGVTVFRHQDAHVLEVQGQRYRRRSSENDRLSGLR